MNKHTPEITPDERAALLDEAATLAKSWAALGRECDDANRFPTETVDGYKRSSIVSMAVPRRLGGLGADMLTVSLVGLELAKGDPAIALAYNMHQAMVGIFRNTRLWTTRHGTASSARSPRTRRSCADRSARPARASPGSRTRRRSRTPRPAGGGSPARRTGRRSCSART